jgi:hypothetical protein
MRSLLLAAAVPFTDYQKIIAHKGYVVSDIYYDLLHYNRSGNQHLADTVQGVVSQWYPQIEEGVRPNGGFARPAS